VLGQTAGVYLAIPVRVENVPRDLEVAADWLSVESPWRSGWSTSPWLRSDAPGKKWLVVSVDAHYFVRVMDDTVRLRGSLDLILFAPSDGLLSFGKCWADASSRFACLSPLPRTRITRVWGDGNVASGIAGAEVSAPYPTSPWFGPLQKYSAPDIGGDATLIADHPVAYIQRSFDLGPLRLSDYRVVVP
jgi:hypothetical protein